MGRQSKPQAGVGAFGAAGVARLPAEARLTIGELSKAAEIHVETIRYYQRLGLVAAAQPPAGGIRRYGGAAVARLRFIKRAQVLGFTLQEVGQLLRLDDGDACSATRALAESKLTSIDQRLADLGRMRRSLKQLLAQCAAGQRPRSCPIIEALSGRV